jgi:indoleamine 2,3-dioxygenase
MAPDRGFLPVEDPLQGLGAEFEQWENLLDDLPKLLAAHRLRSTIAAELNDVPDLRLLTSERELARAMMLLSFLAHGYIFEEDEPATALPPGLAVPWVHVAKLVGRPPILSYASHALDNWKRFSGRAPIELGNLARLANFYGGLDEEWFLLAHIEIEAEAAPGLVALLRAQEAASNADGIGVAACLEAAASALEAMITTLRRIPERCEPFIYYRRVRQFIHGWSDNPAFPQGMVYEGVTEFQGKGRFYRGETGAQSMAVPAFDAALGITFPQNELSVYADEMSAYTPPGHRAFVTALRQRDFIRGYVRSMMQQRALVDAYDACVVSLAEFRSIHLRYAASFIHAQSQRSAANPVGVGTAGTPFMRYLAEHVECVGQHRMGNRTFHPIGTQA